MPFEPKELDKLSDKVVALMASDGTGWQDEYIEGLENHEAGIVWNSKRPSGKADTLKFLRNIIEEGNSFNLYYCSRGKVNYKATVIDFAEGQKELDEKEWNKKITNIKNYEKQFDDYNHDNKKASIVFLAKTLEKINPIAVSEFNFYNGYDAPRQDNLSPIKYEPETVTDLISFNKKVIKKMNSNNKQLNQILFGPPGTGKTYNTINKAIAIVNPDFNLAQSRDEIKKEFERLMKEGQIVFTTFHQSMSYEDFIEGIKPIEPKSEGQTVIYKVIPGILKELCERIKNLEKLTASNLLPAKSVSTFNELHSAFIKKLKQIISELEENETHSFESRRSKVKLIEIDGDSILTTGETANSTETVTKAKLERIYNKFKSPDEITNIVKQIREVGTDIGWTTNYFAVFKALKEFEASINTSDTQNISSYKKQNYVLIIDEINRGNVSQIFGELITLIEEDKRLGKEEALEAILPYSKERFGVPPNLYIIGTMNTADRSVEALDAALRRRFSFEEISPNPELIATAGKLKNRILEDINLPDLLSTINRRVEKLLDKDHQIGHSYFMAVTSLDELKVAFQNKIIPLLQEYFFGDYGKIGLVLGNGFIETEEQNKNIFADFGDYDASEFAERTIYKFKDIAKMSEDDFKKAIKVLLRE